MIEKSSSVHRVLKTHVITQLLRKCKVFLTKVLTVQEDNDIWLLLAVTSLSLVAQVKTDESIVQLLVWKIGHP